MLDCDYLIIGAGQTGLTVASNLAEKGKKIILVDQNKIGGSYLFTYEYPKNLLLDNAVTFSKSLDAFGENTSTFQALLNYRKKIGKQIIKNIQQKHKSWLNYFSEMENVQVIVGMAEFLSKSLIEVNSTTERHLINFRHCVIATGQDQLVKPSIVGLENIDFLYKDNCFLFDYEIPSQIALIGLNEETLEVAGLFAHLGIKVDILDKHADLVTAFNNIDKSIINYFFKKLFAKQVDLHFNFDVKEVKSSKKHGITLKNSDGQTKSFPQIYLPLKESFSGKNLAISKIGIKSTKNGILTDVFGRTSQSHIYALGECSNKCNRLSKQFMIEDFLQLNKKRVDLSKFLASKSLSLEENIFSVAGQDPIFSVGLAEDKALNIYGNSVKSLVIKDEYGEGFVKIIYRDITGKLLGVSLAGDLCNKMRIFILDAFQKGRNYKEVANQMKIYLGTK